MKKYYYNNLKRQELTSLVRRPSIDLNKAFETVKPILNDIKLNGLKAVLKYAKQFDSFEPEEISVTEEEFAEAEKKLEPKIKQALETAHKNIHKFHKKQKPKDYFVETIPGVSCAREYRAIENVGLYVPGGSAILPSTMLMLGIPAKIAGCKRVVVCSPVKNGKINYPLLYAARLCGIKEFYKIGGAQAIGMMAYGTEEISKADKIFGPGNQYVTAAKLLVSTDPDACTIDMPAGPSEVLIIADESADPSFAAADLLAQAEHGIDSQVILVTNSENFSIKIEEEINRQIMSLPRKEIILKSLTNSFVVITANINEAINFSNLYAPEHLILNIKNPDRVKSLVQNAGSVFLGGYSPESAGDYASGTNHSLPTYGYARSFSGVTVESFMKSISFQSLSKNGLKKISKTVETLAEAEGLQAHKNAVTIRFKK